MVRSRLKECTLGTVGVGLTHPKSIGQPGGSPSASRHQAGVQAFSGGLRHEFSEDHGFSRAIHGWARSFRQHSPWRRVIRPLASQLPLRFSSWASS